jgi:hypothetical protein
MWCRGHVDGPLETACMSSPDGMVLARDGCILIADSDNNVIRSGVTSLAISR